MRVKNSIRNMFSSVILKFIGIIVNLIAKAVFINVLGSEYLGLNSLFSNVISMLSIVELGIGSSIAYYLYKPIVENDIEKQKSLMKFYKKCYVCIGIIILFIGLIIMPLIPYFIEELTINVNINFAYILFLLSVVFSYFLSYKRNILYANQKNYIINIIHIVYVIVINVIQIAILYTTKNYYLFLSINIIMTILENVVINFIVNKQYNYLKDKDVKKLDKDTRKGIFLKTKGMLFHKIGGFVVLGTDNLLISKFIGLITLGIYSNYCLIINAVKSMIFQIIQATTASTGNLIVTESKEKQYDIFKKIHFINFLLTTITGIALLLVMENFITIWIGEEYLLSTNVLIVIIVNYYFICMRATFYVFKDAASLYYEDRYVPIIESITNIVVSLILIKFIGLSGVFLGTIISSFWLFFYSYPKYVYKKLFNKGYLSYFKEILEYIFLFFLILLISFSLSNIYSFDNIYLEFLKNCILSIVIPSLILVAVFYRTDKFKYFVKILKNIFKRNKVLS
ncbi:MAG: oligosaccharide flippase family protein [Bacilli bacterium]|nr:oligosaccharide flippase family protein [Bacilli bacterium]